MLAEVKGCSGDTLGGAITVAELIEKLSAMLDKTARVVKNPGPWDGLNEPGQIYDGYLDNSQCKPMTQTESTSLV